MDSIKFSELLRAAVEGNPYAVETILSRYLPLINHWSMIDGKLDEDLRQYIMMQVIMQIPKFHPNNTK